MDRHMVVHPQIGPVYEHPHRIAVFIGYRVYGIHCVEALERRILRPAVAHYDSVPHDRLISATAPERPLRYEIIVYIDRFESQSPAAFRTYEIRYEVERYAERLLLRRLRSERAPFLYLLGKLLHDLSRFPAPLRESIERVTERTAANRGLHLVIALGYGGREDIVNAARVAAKQGKIDKEHFEEALSSHGLPPLDLIVRSGGERRLSGFMLYEAAYAELLFLDKLWPDMTAEDVDAAFGDFAARTRKFGA